MIKVPKPTISVENVYCGCVQKYYDQSLKDRLLACKDLIIKAQEEFETKITKGRIHSIKRETLINGNVTAEELKKVYTYQMVQNEPGRTYYNTLILAARYNLCPLCGHRDVTTLDHYLPKTDYPRLSVAPINLIPSCKDCNTGKLRTYPTTPEEETLHPYFDDIENYTWLKATIIANASISISFYVDRVKEWDDLLYKRVKNHFESFNLRNLYAVQASRELVARKHQLIEVFDSGAGGEGIRKLLSTEAVSRGKSNINSWQTALYSALATNDWFCQQGFRKIGT